MSFYHVFCMTRLISIFYMQHKSEFSILECFDNDTMDQANHILDDLGTSGRLAYQTAVH